MERSHPGTLSVRRDPSLRSGFQKKGRASRGQFVPPRRARHTMKAHLLIVDDDANTLASLSRAFRLAGHEATVCDNPIKALDMIKNEKYDLIFSDVVMPAMNGLALLEQIKIAGVVTPVVMMSGQ